MPWGVGIVYTDTPYPLRFLSFRILLPLRSRAYAGCGMRSFRVPRCRRAFFLAALTEGVKFVINYRFFEAELRGP